MSFMTFPSTRFFLLFQKKGVLGMQGIQPERYPLPEEYPVKMVDLGQCVMLIGRIPENNLVIRTLSKFFSIDWCDGLYRLGFFSSKEECVEVVRKAKMSGSIIASRIRLIKGGEL